MTSVTASSLSITYDGAKAVEGLELSVSEGSWVTLIGPNGAGKTSVLRAVAGLIAFEGEIRVGPIYVRKASRKTLARLIAYVPQRPFIPSGATVTDYVLMGRNPYIGYLSTEKAADLEAVEEVLERLDLVGYATREVARLSGGEAQRVVLGRALAQRAPILLLDEPTSELDIGNQQHVLELVDRLRVEVGLTVLSTMHDLTLAGQYSKEFVLLEEGRAIATGTAEEVLHAELIGRSYGASVDVVAHAAGPIVVPTRTTRLKMSP